MLRSLCRNASARRSAAEAQAKRADELYLENLQLQKELLRYKKATYGPRADRLSENELAQTLLEFAEELEQKPLPAESVPRRRSRAGSATRTAAQRAACLSEFRTSSGQHARL